MKIEIPIPYKTFLVNCVLQNEQELRNIIESGRISKQLYQKATVKISGFEDTDFNDNFFDVAIGNVPFGNYKVYDRDYEKHNFKIHDYFIAKTLDKVRPLSEQMRLIWNRKINNGFFMRTEDFFNFSIDLKEKQKEFDRLAKEYDQTLNGYGRDLAMGAALSQKRALEEKYKGNLDNMSHGEAFLHLFSQRISNRGIYILDEPETPLSPSRQLTLISLIKEAAKRGCQFIIATHSPILLAYPNATIYSFNELTPKKVFFDELEHVTLTRDFLNDPKAFLKHL